MEMDELLRNIEKARADALGRARSSNAEADATHEGTSKLALQLSASTDVAIARALDTILGLNTPVPIIENG